MDLALLAKQARPGMNLLQKEVFVRNLAFIYRLIEASEHLLLRALVRTDDDDFADWLKKHQREEEGHAAILKEDLERLGLRNIPEFFDAAMLAGSQYYFIEHRNPKMLLGYMAVLEGESQTKEVVDRLEKAHGPLRCCRLHSDLDPGHFEEIQSQISRQLPSLRRDIESNAAFVAQKLRKVMEKLNG